MPELTGSPGAVPGDAASRPRRRPARRILIWTCLAAALLLGYGLGRWLALPPQRPILLSLASTPDRSPILRVEVEGGRPVAEASAPEGLTLLTSGRPGMEIAADPGRAGEETASGVGSGWAVVPAELLARLVGASGPRAITLRAAQPGLRLSAGGAGPVVVARCAETVVAAGARRVRLWTFPGDPAGAASERLVEAFARLAGDPDRDLTLALLPLRDGNPMVLAAGAGTVAASGPAPSWPAELRAARWRSIGEAVARAWMGDRPASGPAATARERWLHAALPGFLAGRAVRLAGLGGDGESERLEILLANLDRAASPRHLARPEADRRETALLWQAAGPLALAEADRRLRGGAGGAWVKALLESGALPPGLAGAGDRLPAADEIARLGPDRLRHLDVLIPGQAAPLPEPVASGAGLPRSRVAWGSPDGGAVPARPPDLILVVWAEGQGHVENCGCVINQSGGVARRRAAVHASRALGLPVVTIDLGGSLAPAPRGREEPLLRRETEMYTSSLDATGLDVWVAGVEELSRGPERLAALSARAGAPTISATARWSDGAAGELLPWTSLPAGSAEVAVVGLTGPSRIAQRTALAVTAPAAEVAWPQEAREAVDRAIAEAKRRARLVVVAGQIQEPEARRLARSGQVDLVLTSASQPVPRDPGPYAVMDRRLPTLDLPPNGFAGRGAVIHAAIGSMGLYRVSLWLGSRGVDALALEEMFLDDHVKEDPELAAAIRGFYRRIAADPALRTAGRPPLASLAAERDPARSYLGSEACLSCHLDESAQWMGTAHARAMSTLRRRHRHFDPTCVPCHVVGYASGRGGYSIGVAAVAMEDVGCETCHGPGSAHAASGDPRLVRGKPGPEVCVPCHHGQHDPGFQAAVTERFAEVRHRPGS